MTRAAREAGWNRSRLSSPRFASLSDHLQDPQESPCCARCTGTAPGSMQIVCARLRGSTWHTNCFLPPGPQGKAAHPGRVVVVVVAATVVVVVGRVVVVVCQIFVTGGDTTWPTEP